MIAPSQRKGIASGGNWIVDRVKTVDTLPGRGMLANIRTQVESSGGAPANVLADLARLQAPFPIAGFGCVGNDADGQFMLAGAGALGIDVAGIVRAPAPTSYTDVMNEKTTGERMFFHNRGANARFAPEHVPVDALTCRIFHLGYLLLLDTMDGPDPQYGTVAARLLASLRAAGIKTSVDVVSEESDRYTRIVPPALQYTDYLIVNEIEASRIVGLPVRGADNRLDGEAVMRAVDALFAMGDMALVVVHMPEGAACRNAAGERRAVGSLALPDAHIKGSVGAGDAFCAGVLYGLHEGWDPERAMRLGCCCAAASLSAAGATEGLGPLAEVLALSDRFPWREPPIHP